MADLLARADTSPVISPGPALQPLSVLTPHVGDIRIDTPGTVLEGLDVKGSVTIAADGVTIRNTRVTAASYAVIRVEEGVRAAVIDNVVIDGQGQNGLPGSAGIMGTATVQHTEVSGVENGIVPADGTLVSGTCIHHLSAPGADPHYDGVQMDGGLRDIVVRDSVIDVSDVDATSTVMMDNQFGPMSNVTIQHNVLVGGAYVLYVDGRKSQAVMDASIVVTRNVMAKGKYGTWTRSNSTATISSNIELPPEGNG